MGIVRDFDDLAQNIANPPPNRPLAAAAGNFGRSVCDAVGSNPGLYAPTFLQWPIRAVCKPYWDGEGYDGPSETPTPGGQCQGKSYTATWERRVQAGDGSFSWVPTEAGVTFSGPVEVFAGPDNGGLGCGSGLTLVQYGIRGFGGGNPTGLTGGCVDIAPGYRNLVLTATDGSDPQECGDGNPVVTPGANPPPNTPPPPAGTGPQFGPRGNPIFVLPPNLPTGPGINISLPNGEVNLGSGTGNGPPLPPLAGEPQPGEGGAGPGGAGGSGGGDNPFPEPPLGERWVGCCINITTSPVGQGIIPASLPESIYPNVIGNVRLTFSTGNLPDAYDTPITNKFETCCVWEPVRGFNPTGVRVNLNPGFAYTVTPYSVPEGD